MTETEAQECLYQLGLKFGTWAAKSGAGGMEPWLTMFRRMDCAAVRASMQDFWEATQYDPKPAKFREVYAMHAPRREQDGQADGMGYCGLSLVCSEPPPAFPGRARMTIPLMFGSSGKIPQNEQTLWDIAERERRVCEEMYGGRWQIRRDAGDGGYQPDSWTRYAQAGQP